MYRADSKIDVEALRSGFAGQVVEPGDDGWDAARQAWNLAVDQCPAAVALPESSEGVAAAVRFAREHELRVAPQSTGHNASPMGSLERTLLLKTERMRGVRIDAEARRARAEGGAQWVDVTAPASELGLAAISGSAPDVGVAGYHLGGGLSIGLGRKFGLAANYVTAAELVTAEGEVVRADATSEPDLFWAIRGGGGNFGVVTALEFDLVPLSTVYAGMLAWPLEAAEPVLSRWLEWTAEAPDEITTSLRLMRLPDMPDLPEPFRGRALVVIDGAYAGDAAAGEGHIAALRELGPEIDLFTEMPPVGLSYIHMDPPEPIPGVSDHQMLGPLGEEATERLLGVAGPGVDTPLLMVELRHLGGALAREAEDGGALSSFAGKYLTFAAGIPVDAEVTTAIHSSLASLRDAVAPFDVNAPYLNFAENPTDASSAFSADAARRLRQVKAAYDPSGLFQANHEIEPA